MQNLSGIPWNSKVRSHDRVGLGLLGTNSRSKMFLVTSVDFQGDLPLLLSYPKEEGFQLSHSQLPSFVGFWFPPSPLPVLPLQLILFCQVSSSHSPISQPFKCSLRCFLESLSLLSGSDFRGLLLTEIIFPSQSTFVTRWLCTGTTGFPNKWLGQARYHT